jgi:hypothetical protein
LKTQAGFPDFGKSGLFLFAFRIGMEKVYDLNGQNEIFLQMTLQKGAFEVDPNGDFLFDVEASNENLDFEEQRVLQQALLGSKNYFLTNGVVSKDHRHQQVQQNGKITYDESFIIGEPIDVYTDGGSVRVKGKLYESNPYAQEFMRLLRDGSTRVKASVGGLVPKVVNKIENGVKVGNVVSFLWNDMALTVAPVNPTVSPAVMVSKSLSSLEFVKALTAGYGTDSADFIGGRALQKEDVEHETVKAAIITDEAALESLIGSIMDGEVTDYEDAVKFLAGFGISKEAIRTMIQAVAENHKEISEVLPMEKSNLWGNVVDRLRKAIGGKPDDDDVDPDNLDQKNEEGEVEDDDVEDATPVLKALAENIEKLGENQNVIAESLAALLDQSTQNATLQKSIGESLLAVMERTEQIAGSPAPRKSALTALEAAMMKKSGLGGGGKRHRQFTPADLDEAKDILCKAVADKKLTILESGKAETQINKSILNPAFQIDQKFLSILAGIQ